MLKSSLPLLRSCVEAILARDDYVRSSKNPDLHLAVTLIMFVNEYNTYRAYEFEEQKGSIDELTSMKRTSFVFLDELCKYTTCDIVDGKLVKNETKRKLTNVELFERIGIVYNLHRKISNILGIYYDLVFTDLVAKRVHCDGTLHSNVFEYLIDDMHINKRCLHKMTLYLLLSYVQTINPIKVYYLLNRLVATFIGSIENELENQYLDIVLKRISGMLVATFKFVKVDRDEYFKVLSKKLSVTSEGKDILNSDITFYRNLISFKIYLTLSKKYKGSLNCNASYTTWLKYMELSQKYPQLSLK